MFRTIALMIIAVFVVSCSTAPYKPYAREVKKKPTMNGVIALKTDHVPEDRAYADQLMNKNCGDSKVVILEEGEVEIGKTTSSNATQTKEDKVNWGTLAGMKMTSPKEKNTAKTSTTVTIKEWQINYNCETAVAATPAVKAKKKK